MHVSRVVAAFALLQLLVYGLLASHMPLSGDEIWYVAASNQVLALFPRLVALDLDGTKEILGSIIDRGWFMPGMAFILAPVRFFTDSVPIIRFYVGALNFAAIATILVYLEREWGRRGPLIYLLCCLLVPYYLVYSFALWGDLTAAHLVLCLLLLVFRRRKDFRPPRLGFAATVGVALGLITMVRGFYWMFAPLFAAIFALAAPAPDPMSGRLRRSVALSVALLLGVAVVLAPWTVSITRHLGFHVTTTSTAISRMVLVGSDEYFGHILQDPCYPKGAQYTHPRDISRLDNYIRCLAYREGHTYAAQSRIELAAATTAVSYADEVRAIARNVRVFALDNSEEFLERFSNESYADSPAQWRQTLFNVLMKLNHWGWRALLTIAILLFLVPMAPFRDNLFLSTIYKYGVALYSTHPFMVDAHGRYYVEYVPFVAVAIAAFVTSPHPLLARKRPSDDLQWLVIAGQVLALLAAPALAIAYFAAS